MYSASLTSIDSSPANALGASLGRGLLDASNLPTDIIWTGAQGVEYTTD